MGVRIRFARLGCRNNPFYRIIVTDSLSPRDGRQLEVLGFFNPLSGKDDPKRMALKYERVKYWLSVGAQPSEPVERILLRAGLLPPPPLVASGRKGSGSDLSSEKPEQPAWSSLSIPVEGGPTQESVSS